MELEKTSYSSIQKGSTIKKEPSLKGSFVSLPSTTLTSNIPKCTLPIVPYFAAILMFLGVGNKHYIL